MAMSVPKAPGYAQMMKEGSRYFAGIEEAVIRNIEACTEFSRTLKTSYGPKGLNKMVINHLEKLFVTNDAATIIRELQVEHPAAKLIVMASQMQEQEVGDGTNFVIQLAGALLHQAEDLIRMGLKPTEIIEGYEMAKEKILDDLLKELVCDEVKDCTVHDDVMKGVKTAVMSKQYGNEAFLAELIVKACISILNSSNQTSLNVDNIRVCKILGSGILKSEVVQGMVFKKSVEGVVNKVENAKVAVYTCPLDVTATETKGTVLIKSAEELVNFSRGEENMLEAQIKAIADTGVKVIVSGGKYGDLALHYCNQYNLMAVRLQSKFDVRRLCRTVGATALPKIQAPTQEEIGHCDHVYVDEIGENAVVVFKQDSNDTRVVTIVIRGSTDNVMDDIERAVDDGVNTFKALTKDGRLLPGAGATEIELAAQIASFGETLPGMEQYAVGKYSEALQSIPAAIADNAGVKASDLVTLLLAAHAEGNKNAAVDIEKDIPSVVDAVNVGLYDLYLAKYWGIKYATNVANTILQVDHIICAKQAGGPKPRQGGGDWDQD